MAVDVPGGFPRFARLPPRSYSCWRCHFFSFRQNFNSCIVRPSVLPSLRPFVRPSVRPSVRPLICPSLRPSVRPSARKPISDFFYMAIVIFALSVTVYEIFTVKLCMTSTLTFKMGKVQCKHTNRKPMSDFLCLGNRNICSICHRLRDNYVQSTEMVSIRIFDRKKVGQRHELQLRRIRHRMCFSVAYNSVENGGFISSCFPLVHQRDRRTHGRTDRQADDR